MWFTIIITVHVLCVTNAKPEQRNVHWVVESTTRNESITKSDTKSEMRDI